MRIPFTKMTGAGNDFIVVDWRKGAGGIRWTSLAPVMCDRRSGIGADGLIVIVQGAGDDFIMEYFNADGSAGSMCGNGGRCAASFMMDQLHKKNVTFTTCGRRYSATTANGGISLTMNEPGDPRLALQLKHAKGTLRGHYIDTGAPHLVVWMDNLRAMVSKDTGPPADITEIGRNLRHHPEFAPTGTNVDFVSVEAGDRINVRTYEKGVEAETHACGTGAVASAAIYSILEGREGDNRITVVPSSGEELKVSFHRKGTSITGVRLDGPAVATFTGSIELPF